MRLDEFFTGGGYTGMSVGLQGRLKSKVTEFPPQYGDLFYTLKEAKVLIDR